MINLKTGEIQIKHTPYMINIVTCNKCGKRIKACTVEYTMGEEPNICQCEDNYITIETPYITQSTMDYTSTKVAYLECGECQQKTSAYIPEYATQPIMVKLYCVECKTTQYHHIIDKPYSALDAMLQEST